MSDKISNNKPWVQDLIEIFTEMAKEFQQVKQKFMSWFNLWPELYDIDPHIIQLGPSLYMTESPWLTLKNTIYYQQFLRSRTQFIHE